MCLYAFAYLHFCSMKACVVLRLSMASCRFSVCCLAIWFVYGSSSPSKVFFGVTLFFLLEVLMVVILFLMLFGVFRFYGALELPDPISVKFVRKLES